MLLPSKSPVHVWHTDSSYDIGMRRSLYSTLVSCTFAMEHRAHMICGCGFPDAPRVRPGYSKNVRAVSSALAQGLMHDQSISKGMQHHFECP